MFDVGRRNERADRAGEGNGYVETDPTGRYGRFEEVLGKGAMKTVYRAFDEVNGVEVAWNQAKISDVLRSPDALERMYSEVHLLSSLHHDSIIKFHATWIHTESRTFNFITEMFTSGTLREYRQRYRRVDMRAIKSWARQILHGLAYLHGHDPPVIHRDLKCDNIFVNGHLGQVKIGDLGLAAVLRGSQCAHSVIGTPEFMAPELYDEEYNELVDIYSFGMCVLEMVTSEYPYSECSNPARIYKKVTSGMLPDAFHRVQDPEAKRFIGKCLEKVGKRSSAKDLLLDPFLASDEHRGASSITKNAPSAHRVRSLEHLSLPEAMHPTPVVQRADMTITGKMNPEDDSIILKVQIGATNNIYFPFDIESDTPSDVANEMVKELEITDREPSEISEMIAQAISLLVPGWKEGSEQHVYSYGDEDEDVDGYDHPVSYVSSPTSSHDSVFGTGNHPPPLGGFALKHQSHLEDWIRDELFTDDDDNSSMHSGKYFEMNYASGNEQEAEASVHRGDIQPSASSHRSTRFGPDECSGSCADADAARAANKLQGKLCSALPEPSWSSAGGKRPVDGRRLMRNRSMVDVRSQLLHRTLVEELNKRMFKTVNAMESIGFQMPCEVSRSACSSPGGDGGKQKQVNSTRRV